MSKTVRLIHDNGAAVTVDAEKVERLLAQGFRLPAPAPRRTPRKK